MDIQLKPLVGRTGSGESCVDENLLCIWANGKHIGYVQRDPPGSPVTLTYHATPDILEEIKGDVTKILGTMPAFASCPPSQKELEAALEKDAEDDE